MFLETERVKLREITTEDEIELYRLDGDPDVMRYISRGLPSSKEDVSAAVQRVIALRGKHGGRFGCWAAIEKSSGIFIGWFLFRPAHEDAENLRRIELGYRLKKSYWGRGLATEVSKALIEMGFKKYQIEEVFAVAVKDNIGSQAVMKKSGMVFVREFTSGDYTDSVEDLVEFSLTRESYQSLRGQ